MKPGDKVIINRQFTVLEVRALTSTITLDGAHGIIVSNEHLLVVPDEDVKTTADADLQIPAAEPEVPHVSVYVKNETLAAIVSHINRVDPERFLHLSDPSIKPKVYEKNCINDISYKDIIAIDYSTEWDQIAFMDKQGIQQMQIYLNMVQTIYPEQVKQTINEIDSQI